MERSEGKCNELREEFRVSKLGLNHDDPSLFVKPQCLKPWMYIIWTSFWALFYLVTLSLEIFYNIDYGGKYFIYLTNLSYLLQSVNVYLDFTITIYVHWRCKDIRDGDTANTTWYIQVLWTVFNINNVVSIMVTLMYYALLDPNFNHSSINTHLLNSVYTLSTLLFCAKPLQILHFYQPIIFGFLYTVFSIIYHIAGGDPIYSVLDWNKTGNTALFTCFLLFIGIPVLHIVMFALYTLRKFVSEKCVCYKDKNEELKREITARDVELLETNGRIHSANKVGPTANKY
ncbi:hypothetical protein ACF0H5_015086 [Mactra antiquata]